MGGMTSNVADSEFVKRQVEDLNEQLELERKTTGSIIQKQEQEIEECKKELEDQKDNEKKLKAR